MAWSEDPTDFLNDLGVSVSAGGVTGMGILNMPGEYMVDDRVISNEYVLQVETSRFGFVSYGDSITVDGDAYQVREPPLILDDGVFCLVLLTKTTSTLAPATTPSDADAFLSDFGLTVAADGVTGLGIFDTPSEYIASGRAISDEYLLRVETAKFGGIAYNDNITVEGETYRVRESPRMVDDGMFCLVLLTKPIPVFYRLLLEDGFNVLKEDNDKILLEA